MVGADAEEGEAQRVPRKRQLKLRRLYQMKNSGGVRAMGVQPGASANVEGDVSTTYRLKRQLRPTGGQRQR